MPSFARRTSLLPGQPKLQKKLQKERMLEQELPPQERLMFDIPQMPSLCTRRATSSVTRCTTQLDFKTKLRKKVPKERLLQQKLPKKRPLPRYCAYGLACTAFQGRITAFLSTGSSCGSCQKRSSSERRCSISGHCQTLHAMHCVSSLFKGSSQLAFKRQQLRKQPRQRLLKEKLRRERPLLRHCGDGLACRVFPSAHHHISFKRQQLRKLPKEKLLKEKLPKEKPPLRLCV